MSSPILKTKLKRLVGPIGLAIIVFSPLVGWVVDSLKANAFLFRSPYSVNDVYLILIFAMLALIYETVYEGQQVTAIGDESKIIPNRNQSDYYEIWEEVRGFRDVELDALGHSFNTLWFNFIKKFLYEVVSNERHFNSVVIRLISTRPNPASFADIREYYESLDLGIASKIRVELYCVPSETLFFTGCCINKSALWISIREPHTVGKGNEHVREWRRSRGGTAEKMVNWFVGIMEFLARKASVEILHVQRSAQSQRKRPHGGSVAAP